MFKDVLQQVTSIFDRRFLLNAFFPSLIFWGLISIVVIAGLGWDLVKVAQAWNQQDATLKILQILGFVSWVTFFAGILSSLSTAILRFYEGYWNFPLSQYLVRMGKNWHQARLQELDPAKKMNDIAQQLKNLDQQKQQHPDQQADLERQQEKLDKQYEQLQKNQGSLYEAIYRYYPKLTSLDQVMPTRLGNILKNAELYSYDRYNLDAVLVWPRLYNLFPERFVQIIAEARSSLDFMLAISALSGFFALVSGVFLLVVKASGWLFLACFWGGALIAWLAYRSALGSALLYAEQIKACFDLYRNELIKQLRLKLPETPDEETSLWREIRQLLYGGEASNTWTYSDPDAKKG